MTTDRNDVARRRAWQVIPIAGALLVALFFALPTGSNEQSVVYDVIGLAAVGAAIAGVIAWRPAGWLPWLVLAAGQLAFVVGDVLWTTFAAIGEDPFPSVADVAYLLGYPLLALGLGVAIRRRISGGDVAGLLDGAILAAGAVVIWSALILGPVAAASDPEPLAFVISIAYPIGDLLLVGMALGLVMAPGARSPSFGFLVASLLVMLAADLAFAIQNLDSTYVDGGWLDGVWLASYLLFAGAACHPSMAALFDPRPVSITLLGPFRLALLGGAMLIGPALLAIDHAGTEAIVLVIAGASAVVSVLVLGRLAGVVGHLARDIERRAVLEQQLSYQALHDPLTGLANRRRFIDAVGASLAAASGSAVLFLDLDDFKIVNDEMGHDAGDGLLTAIGNRLVATIRERDLACRIGGDEFAVLLPTPDALQAEAAAARLVAALAEPIMIEGRQLTVSASVGVGVATAGERMTVDEILRRADVAMYRAKARGKHRWATYTPELDEAATLPVEHRHERSEGAVRAPTRPAPGAAPAS